MKFEAILFDMDGVIVESESASMEYIGKKLKDAGYFLSQAQLEALIGLDTTDTIKGIIKMLNAPLSYEQGQALIQAELFTQEICQGLYEIPLIEGFSDLAEAFSGRMKYAIASGSSREVILYHVKKYQLDSSFSAFVSSEEVPKGKPAPDVFIEAAKRLGVPIERCIVIEDGAPGTLAGRAAGAHTIAVPTPYTCRFDFSPAHKICSSLAEAQAYIQTLIG